MKKINFNRWIGIMMLWTLTFSACDQSPKLLSVPAFDEQGNIQLITLDTVPDMAGEKGVIGQVGKTCEFKDADGKCIGVKMIILGKDLPLDEVVPVKPIGTLIIEIDKQSKTLIAGIPFDKSMRTIDPRHFMEFFVDKEPVKRAIESWFLRQYGPEAQLLGWDNDEFGLEHIQRKLYENK